MNKKEKEKKSNQKEWEDFLKNPNNIFDKDSNQNKNESQRGFYKFDFHGYSIEDANKKAEKLINECYEKNFKEILIITGKGTHSDKKDDVYVSRDYNKLQNTLPEFIKNNQDLYSKIYKIVEAPKKLGGDGALIIKLKKVKE